MGDDLETKLVFLFKPQGWRYWREGLPPEGAALMAYTLNEHNQFVRRWWCWPMNAFVDGAEAPLPQPDCRLVNPATIALNTNTFKFNPDATRLPGKPKRLAERWTDWHNSQPRVVHYESWLQTIKRFFS